MNRSRDRHQYFMQIAQTVATRSTCNRAHVGAVLVRDNRILATGYNGSVAGHPHCDDVGHLMVDGHCVRTVHSEVNAIIQCAIHGVSTMDADLYCTHAPCLSCAKALLNAGVRHFFYDIAYRADPLVFDLLFTSGMELEKISL